MKTRFSSLVGIKKDAMQKSERILQEQNHILQQAQKAYDVSVDFLSAIQIPNHGKIADFLASRELLEVQRSIIEKNHEWILFAQSQVKQAQENLKKAMMEYEKFNYLELEEIKAILKEQKLQEAKELDEIALLTFTKKSSLNGNL
jgi:flagellar biosynthesis chaperone FliJ